MPARPWPFWKTVPRFDREYSAGDFVRAGAALISRKNATHAGRTEIERHFSPAQAYFARSGRECLYLFLKMLRLRPKSRVGVPLYCCAAVFETIVAAGHVPFFLDIDLATYALDEACLRQNGRHIDALVVVHTFGYPANVKRLRECLDSRRVPIIEDCAHSLFAECEGRLAGTWGDAAFITFGMHKPAAVGGGAVLFVNNAELVPAAEREFAGLDVEGAGSELRHSLICWARSLSYHRVAYGALLASPVGRFRDEEFGVPEEDGPLNLDPHWSPSKMRSVDEVLLASRIQEFQIKMPRLARNTQKLREIIGESPLTMPEEPSYGTWNHFMVPVRYKSGSRRESGRRFLMQRGVDTSPLFRNCVRNGRWVGYEGGCPNSEQAGQTLCTVPNHAGLSDEEISFIGESVRLSAELD
ncbi:MAG: DegT/DnrJ/EryC1/StrS family aminotransferase [Candidatus Acidiferrales bacterium]